MVGGSIPSRRVMSHLKLEYTHPCTEDYQAYVDACMERVKEDCERFIKGQIFFSQLETTVLHAASHYNSIEMRKRISKAAEMILEKSEDAE